MVHIVIDLEMNPVDKKFRDVRRFLSGEIIEIGAIKLDKNYQPIDKFQCYVRPEFGSIASHITKLTGITDETVANEKLFADEFKNFMDWIGTWNMTIYSWSHSDIQQLRNECAYKIPKFDMGRLERQWKDLQKMFDDRIGLKNSLALKHAVGAMNRDFAGTEHTALADAENTAAILTLLQDDEEFFRVMQPVIDLLKPRELSQSIGDLFPELMNLKLDDNAGG